MQTRQPIVTRPVAMLLIASVGALGSFYLLLPVVPLYVATAGAGSVGAGLATGTMMLATVLAELVVPRLLDRFGYRAMMALGLVLLGAPALVLAVGSALPVVLAVCLVRGAGLGIVVVTGAALIAELTPPERRGEGLGIYGIAVGIPSVVCLPLGVWLVGEVGYEPVFVAGALLGLLAVLVTRDLPVRSIHAEELAAESGPAGGVLGALRIPGLAAPAVVFAAVTLAAGVVLTFLPLAVPPGSAEVAAIALLVQSLTSPLARWGAGRYGDRHGSTRLLVPAVLISAFGVALLVAIHRPLAVVAGMGLFGIGFGIAQNATLVLMFERVDRADYGRASALWNLAYDAGVGVGAVGFGLLAGPLGYSTGFGLVAGVLALALGPSWLDHRRATRAGRAGSSTGRAYASTSEETP